MNSHQWLVWALLSAFFAGLTAILAKVGVAGVNPNLATAIRTVVILVLAWMLVAGSGSWREMASLPGRAWLFLILSGLATGLSWICYFQALSVGQAAQVAPIDKLSVVFAVVLAVAFLGESLLWHQWLGVGFIVAGAMLLAVR